MCSLFHHLNYIVCRRRALLLFVALVVGLPLAHRFPDDCGPSHSLHALLYQRCHNNLAPSVSAPDSEPLATTCISGRLVIRIKLRTKPCCRCRTVRSQMNRRRALHHALTDECWTPASLPPPRLRLTSLLQPLVFAVQGQSLLACTHKKCFSIHQASPPCKGMTMHLHHAQ